MDCESCANINEHLREAHKFIIAEQKETIEALRKLVTRLQHKIDRLEGVYDAKY